MASNNTTPTADDAPAAEPAPELSGYPFDLFIGEGAERTWVGEHEYVVDPETGRITGRA